MKNATKYLLFLIVLMVGCTKEMLQDESCESLPQPKVLDPLGLIETYDLPLYEFPYFNPNNPDEFLLFEVLNYDTMIDGISHRYKKKGIYKYNWKTKQKKLIFDGKFSSRPRWSRKGWVLFGRYNGNGNDEYNVWKIKDDGDSLTQLTTTGICVSPEWNYNGNQIIYYGLDRKHVIMDEYGKFIDSTIVGMNDISSWQHDYLIASGYDRGLKIYNPYTGLSLGGVWNVATPYNSDGINGGAEWIDIETVVWENGAGMYRTNVNSRETVLIRDVCKTRYYGYPSYSRQLEKLLLVRLDTKLTDTVTNLKAKIRTKVVMMNTDGTGEEIIEISE